MSNANRKDLITRETILGLLSDEEVALVSTTESASKLSGAEEYLDLQHLELGVQRATASTNVVMGHTIARRAVHPETWRKILAKLAA